MRLPIQAQVVVFRTDPLRFLMLKRTAQKGGFWQCVTGGVEEGETIEAAAKRELFEETGLEPVAWIRDVFSFQFEQDGWYYTEFVFAAEVDGDPVLSEHDEYRWCTFEEAEALVPEAHAEVREALMGVARLADASR